MVYLDYNCLLLFRVIVVRVEKSVGSVKGMLTPIHGIMQDEMPI